MAPSIKGALASILEETAHRIGGDTPRRTPVQTVKTTARNASQRPAKGRSQSKQSRRARTGKVDHGFAWNVPLGKREDLGFDQGEIATLLDITDHLYNDSPAASVAAIHFVAQHNGQSFAHSKLTTLLVKSYPHDAAIQNDQQAMGRLTGDGQLTAKLSHYEIEYLRYVHGIKQFSRTALLQLATNLIDIADAFAQRDEESHRRQGRARFIAADIFLTLGRNHAQSTREMNKALVLAGIAYDNHSIIEIAKRADSGIIEATLVSASSIKHAQELVGQS